VVYAEARTNPDVGYALAPEAVWTRIRPGIGRRSTTDTGPCIH
jgi:hypothetical protein